MSSVSSPEAYRAFVDDEAAIRRFMMMSLVKEGFSCDTAEDGEAAATLIASKSYDLVITDLVLPGKNGHSLAVELLAKPDRPLIVVVTGVLEPRLAKDLMARGIDDIIFKPVEFSTLAAKMRSLVDRKRFSRTPVPSPVTKDHVLSKKLPIVTSEEFESRLRGLTRVPPVSKAAIDVFKLTNNPDSDVRQVAAAAQRDPALITEILRLANSSFFNPSSKKITSLDQAVTRLGQKHVGELALTTAAFASVTQEKLPFFNLGYVWRECLASGICLEMLADQTASAAADCGSLFCAAVLSPMGRIMLASLFPEIYDRLLRQASKDHRPLADIEAQVFPITPGDVVARTLASWGIPDEVHRPLRHVSAPFHALSTLVDPLRRRVELVKTAGLLGKLGTGRWENWETIDVPPASVLKRLGVHTVDAILGQCRDDLDEIASFAGGNAFSAAVRVQPPSSNASHLAYKRLQNETVDLIPHLLATAGVRVINTAAEVSEIDGSVVVNAIDTAAHQVIARLRCSNGPGIIILTDTENAERLQNCGRILSFPMCYGLLRDVCSQIAVPIIHDRDVNARASVTLVRN